MEVEHIEKLKRQIVDQALEYAKYLGDNDAIRLYEVNRQMESYEHALRVTYITLLNIQQQCLDTVDLITSILQKSTTNGHKLVDEIKQKINEGKINE